jgi:hypothetical protein
VSARLPLFCLLLTMSREQTVLAPPIFPNRSLQCQLHSRLTLHTISSALKSPTMHLFHMCGLLLALAKCVVASLTSPGHMAPVLRMSHPQDLFLRANWKGLSTLCTWPIIDIIQFKRTMAWTTPSSSSLLASARPREFYSLSHHLAREVPSTQGRQRKVRSSR